MSLWQERNSNNFFPKDPGVSQIARQIQDGSGERRGMVAWACCVMGDPAGDGEGGLQMLGNQQKSNNG